MNPASPPPRYPLARVPIFSDPHPSAQRRIHRNTPNLGQHRAIGYRGGSASTDRQQQNTQNNAIRATTTTGNGQRQQQRQSTASSTPHLQGWNARYRAFSSSFSPATTTPSRASTEQTWRHGYGTITSTDSKFGSSTNNSSSSFSLSRSNTRLGCLPAITVPRTNLLLHEERSHCRCSRRFLHPGGVPAGRAAR